MKKLLALVLALVMTLGLATVGASAAYSDFTDTADVSFEEAMKVMNAVGVFVGDGNKLDPKGNLTRAQAAKLVAYLALGDDIAEALPKTGSKFADVPDGAWYTGYVNYMVNEGYTTGTSETTFSPDGQLNGYQFGAFLLAVLGYDRALEGMVGNGWETKVAVKLEETGVNNDVDKLGSAALTREEAAQFCLNALKADVVEYSDKGTSIDINGAKITTGAKAATAKVVKIANVKYADKIVDDDVIETGDATLQLGEKLYKGDLVCAADAVDAAGRSADKWTYKTEDVVTAPSSADETYVVSGNSDNLSTLVGILYSKNSKYKFDSKVLEDGDSTGTAAVASSTTDANGTYFTATADGDDGKAVLYVNGENTTDYAPKKGDVIEVYTKSSDDNVIEKVVVLRYELAKVNKVDTNVNATDKANDVTAYITLKGNATKTVKDTKLFGYDAASYVKDAYLAVAYENSGKDEVVDSYVATKAAEGTVSVAKAPDYTIGGTKYAGVNSGLFFDEWGTKDYTGTYAIYTTKDNYALGIVEVEAGTSASDAYFLTRVWTKEGDNGDYAEKVVTTYAQLVDMNGQVSNVVIGKTTTNNKIYGVVAASADVNAAYHVYTSGTNYGVGADGYPSDDALITKKYDRAEIDLPGIPLVTLTEHKSDGYTELKAYTGDSTYSVTAIADQTEVKSTATKIGGLYVNSSTRYIVIDGAGSGIKVTVKNGSLSWSGEATPFFTIYSKDGSARVANYVIIPAEYETAASEDVVYVTSLNEGSNDDGTIMTVYWPDGKKENITVDDATGVKKNTFAKYSENSDGTYDLEPATATTTLGISDDNKDWDSKKTADTGAYLLTTFGSYYNNGLTLNNVKATDSVTVRDIDVDSDVVFVDLHETNNDKYQTVAATRYNSDAVPADTTNADAGRTTYAGSVADLEALNDLPDGYTAIVDAYVTEDGVQAIFVRDVFRMTNTLVTTTAKNTVTNIKALDDGAYQLSTISETDLQLAAGTNPADVKIFKFTGSSANATLTIRDADGVVIYEEALTVSDTAAHFFYIYVGSGNGMEAANYGAWARGTALASGIYNYTITTSAAVRLSGSFEID